MEYVPYDYTQLNIRAGLVNPSVIKPCNNASYAYWQRSLAERAISAIKFTLPDDWRGSIADFFRFCLIRWGYVACFETDDFGFVFQPCALSGQNFYYQFVTATISNPKYQAELKIGEECELIKLTPDYLGIWDIICYYATKLSSLDNAINIAITNSKIAWILGAASKSAAAAIKKAIDLINKGDPAVVFDAKKLLADLPNSNESEPWKLIDLEVKKNYVLNDLLRDFQTILNNFDSEIGIPTIPYEKRERMVRSEAESRTIDSQSRVTVWLECLKSSISIVNEHYGKSISAELRFKESELKEGEEVG